MGRYAEVLRHETKLKYFLKTPSKRNELDLRFKVGGKS